MLLSPSLSFPLIITICLPAWSAYMHACLSPARANRLFDSLLWLHASRPAGQLHACSYIVTHLNKPAGRPDHACTQVGDCCGGLI